MILGRAERPRASAITMRSSSGICRALGAPLTHILCGGLPQDRAITTYITLIKGRTTSLRLMPCYYHSSLRPLAKSDRKISARVITEPYRPYVRGTTKEVVLPVEVPWPFPGAGQILDHFWSRRVRRPGRVVWCRIMMKIRHIHQRTEDGDRPAHLIWRRLLGSLILIYSFCASILDTLQQIDVIAALGGERRMRKC